MPQNGLLATKLGYVHMAPSPQQPIFLRQDAYDTDPPFRGDLFDRRRFANILQQHISRLPQGAVFAVDAQWGDGKTWFARHWAADLKQKGLPVLYLDAFKNDFVEDPFILLASGIVQTLREIDPARGQKLAEAAKNVGKVLLPVIGRIAVGAATNLILGSADAVPAIKDAIDEANKGLQAAVEKQIEKQLDEYAKNLASVRIASA